MEMGSKIFCRSKAQKVRGRFSCCFKMISRVNATKRGYTIAFGENENEKSVKCCKEKDCFNLFFDKIVYFTYKGEDGVVSGHKWRT